MVTAPGKRWRLVYVASKDQWAAACAGKDTLPGLYIDGFANYVQGFEGEGEVRVKREGIAGSLFGNLFFVGDIARVKWPEPETRTTMVVQSMANKLEAFGQEWSSPAEGAVPGPDGDRGFLEAPVRKGGGGAIVTVNYLYADDDVALAQAETGAVALYGAGEAAGG